MRSARSAPVRTSRRRCRTGSRPPQRIDQRRAADHRKRRLGLAVDHFESDAASRRPRGRETLGAFDGGAAGFGCDQPQRACRLCVFDLVAADGERGDGAFDRGLADAAGGRNAFAEPDDPRKRVDHAKAVVGRAAQSAGGNCWCRGRAPHRSRRRDRGQGRGRCDQAPPTATGFAAARPGQTRGRGLRHPRASSLIHKFFLPRRTAPIAPRARHCSLYRKSVTAGRAHATLSGMAALGKQPCRRYFRGAGLSGTQSQDMASTKPKKLRYSHCKNSGSGSRSGARKTTLSCAARANTPTISICRGQAYAWIVRGQPRPWHHPRYRHLRRQSHAGRARRRRLEPICRRRLWPVQMRAAAEEPRRHRRSIQTNRTALMTDKVRYVGDPVAFVVAETLAQARDAGRSRRGRHRSLAGGHRARGSGPTGRAAALRSTSPTMSRSIITTATPRR